MAAGVRPAFADNVPKIVVRGRTLHVNGLYRHGFLLAPVLAELVADYLATGAQDERVFRIASELQRRCAVSAPRAMSSGVRLALCRGRGRTAAGSRAITSR